MNDVTGAGRGQFGFPRETFREIITKSVCGTARKSLQHTHYVDLPRGVVPSQVLGSSVTELRLNEPEVKANDAKGITIGAGGTFEVHVWYAFSNGEETDILRTKVNFEETFILKNYDCMMGNDSLDVKVKVEKSPVVVGSALTEDNRVKLETGLEMSVEVIGETKLLVQVCAPERNEWLEDDEDDEDDED